MFLLSQVSVIAKTPGDKEYIKDWRLDSLLTILRALKSVKLYVGPTGIYTIRKPINVFLFIQCLQRSTSHFQQRSCPQTWYLWSVVRWCPLPLWLWPYSRRWSNGSLYSWSQQLNVFEAICRLGLRPLILTLTSLQSLGLLLYFKKLSSIVISSQGDKELELSSRIHGERLEQNYVFLAVLLFL